jgi:hypothetical protein
MGGRGVNTPHTTPGFPYDPVQSPMPPELVPPGCLLPSCWQPVGVPVVRAPVPQLKGAAEVMGQVLYTAAAVLMLRAVGAVM